MATQYIKRSASAAPATAKGHAAPVYIDSADNRLKIIPTGTTVVAVGLDLSPIATITGDGAITIATGTTVLTKGSAAAITLAAPTAAQAGTRLTIVAGSAFAHVVTATGLLDDGVTGGAKNTATFAAFVGASIELLAYNLKWTVINKNLVTVAA